MKTLKEFLTETYNTTNNKELFECLEERYEVVLRDDYDEHRWYTNYRVVSKVIIDGVERYFDWYNVDPKDEISSRGDCGWEVPDLDKDVKEVFPKQITVTTYE